MFNGEQFYNGTGNYCTSRQVACVVRTKLNGLSIGWLIAYPAQHWTIDLVRVANVKDCRRNTMKKQPTARKFSSLMSKSALLVDTLDDDGHDMVPAKNRMTGTGSSILQLNTYTTK